jgi:hypothetical protein
VETDTLLRYSHRVNSTSRRAATSLACNKIVQQSYEARLWLKRILDRALREA